MAPMRPAPNWQILIIRDVPLGMSKINPYRKGRRGCAMDAMDSVALCPSRILGALCAEELIFRGLEMPTIRLTMAQALIRFLATQTSEVDGGEQPLFAGVFAIFGHGNVAGLGEALYAEAHRLPTLRAHNEQAMALTAVAFAKASRRRRMMACTSSIGPGATNMVTAAAVAHANRLPVLLLPGDIFAGRQPDPVLQQIEAFGDPTISVNDCFRPVSRWWDRITPPQQIVQTLPPALRAPTH